MPGHLEPLAKGERRVYVSLIDPWRPSSTGEIAGRARMDVRAVSTPLGRLVTNGLVGASRAPDSVACMRRRNVSTPFATSSGANATKPPSSST